MKIYNYVAAKLYVSTFYIFSQNHKIHGLTSQFGTNQFDSNEK